MDIIVPFGDLQVFDLLDVRDSGGEIVVIEGGVDAGERFGPEYFFRVESPFRVSELCMPLGRKLPEMIIARHGSRL